MSRPVVVFSPSDCGVACAAASVGTGLVTGPPKGLGRGVEDFVSGPPEGLDRRVEEYVASEESLAPEVLILVARLPDVVGFSISVETGVFDYIEWWSNDDWVFFSCSLCDLEKRFDVRIAFRIAFDVPVQLNFVEWLSRENRNMPQLVVFQGFSNDFCALLAVYPLTLSTCRYRNKLALSQASGSPSSRLRIAAFDWRNERRPETKSSVHCCK